MDVGSDALPQLLFEPLFIPSPAPQSDKTLTSQHYASPCPVYGEDQWRPPWGEELMEWRRPSRPPVQAPASVSPSTGGVRGGHLLRSAPFTSLLSSSRSRRSSALVPPQVYVGETRNTPALRRPIFRSVWPHSRSILHRGSDHRLEDSALLHLLSAPRLEL